MRTAQSSGTRDGGGVSEVVRPAAIVPEDAARAILVAMAERDVENGGVWRSEPNLWTRFDHPLPSGGDGDATGGGAGDGRPAEVLGTVHVAYGTPTKYEITLYRVTVSQVGVARGWTVRSLTDEALGFGGLTLDDCPRAALTAPPPPFHY